jgi:hypothetical protein
MEPLIFLLGAGVLIGYWLNAMHAREVALRAARAACEREGVQLLDETVAMTRVRPARDRAGQPCWRRWYQFEFTEDGGSRRNGELEMLGLRTLSLRLNLSDHTLHQLQ